MSDDFERLQRQQRRESTNGRRVGITAASTRRSPTRHQSYRDLGSDVALEPRLPLERDLGRALATPSRSKIRYLVDGYEQFQRVRKAAASQALRRQTLPGALAPGRL